MAGQQFLISANYLLYAVTVFNFLFLELLTYAVTVSNFPNYLVMQLQFFSGINSA